MIRQVLNKWSNDYLQRKIRFYSDSHKTYTPMVAAPYELFNMGNKTHPQQPDIGKNWSFFFIYDFEVEADRLVIKNFARIFN